MLCVCVCIIQRSCYAQLHASLHSLCPSFKLHRTHLYALTADEKREAQSMTPSFLWLFSRDTRFVKLCPSLTHSHCITLHLSDEKRDMQSMAPSFLWLLRDTYVFIKPCLSLTLHHTPSVCRREERSTVDGALFPVAAQRHVPQTGCRHGACLCSLLRVTRSIFCVIPPFVFHIPQAGRRHGASRHSFK